MAARRQDHDAFLDVRDLLAVSPREVRLCSKTEFNPEITLGRVVDGDWDLTSKEFDSLDISVAVRQVFSEGLPWESTEFYRRLLEDLSRGSRHWGIASREDIDARCAAITRLHDSIKTQGYLTAEHVHGATKETRSPLDEIAVAIGRDGRLLFADGAHRLALAKLLDVGEIPVVVAARHPGWMAFRREVEQSLKASGGAACQPPLHPDMRRVPAHHECARRFTLIRDHMTSEGGELLDIGAHWGYFCHRFEELGFSCTAVEDRPEQVHFLTRLRDSRERRFRIVPKSILDDDTLEDREYAVIVALNIFHHFLKDREVFDRFASLLSRLQATELFLEPHREDEPQMETAEVQLSPAALVDFVADRMRMSKVELLGEADSGGRILYRLARD